MKTAAVKIFVVIAIVGCAALLRADTKWVLPEDDTKFKPGQGSELAVANCVICHSADYVATQPPLDRAAWGAIVQKMREKYGAPVPTNKVDEIVQYLSTTYGKSAKR